MHHHPFDIVVFHVHVYVRETKDLQGNVITDKLSHLFSFLSFLFNSPKNKYRFTKIAVDAQVKTTNGRAYDVLFIGTGKFY
jgi:hypothetical protein